MDENYTEPDLSKIVKQLMDEEGYEFGEAVKKAMEMGYKDGGLMVAIQKFNQGGNVIDSRATVEDMAKSIQSSSAATNDQKLQLLMDYDNAYNSKAVPNTQNNTGGQSGQGSPLFNISNQTAMEKLLGLQTNPNFQYTSPIGPMMLMPPTRSTGFRQGPGYFGNEGIMINGKRYMSEDEAIDDMGVETYNRFMADGGMAGGKTYHQFHDQYVPMDEESMGYAYGGGVGSMMQPKRGLVNAPGGYAGEDNRSIGERIIDNGYFMRDERLAGPDDGSLDISNIIEKFSRGIELPEKMSDEDRGDVSSIEEIFERDTPLTEGIFGSSEGFTLSPITMLRRYLANKELEKNNKKDGGRINFAGGGMDYEPLGYDEDESITVEDLTVPSRVGDFRVSASKPLNDQSGIISAATNIMNPGVNTIEGSLIDGDDPSSRYNVQKDFPSTIDRFSNSVAPVPPGVITDRNRGQIIERAPSTPFDRGITMADIAGPSTIDRFSNTVGPVPNVEATYQDKIMGGLDGDPDPYNFSQNFDQSYDASSDLEVPGMGKKAIDFIDAPVDFMKRANNPNVFDPVVNTKNFVQDGITTLKSNLTPKNIATSAIGSKVGSIFGLPAVLGGFLARSLFGKKEDEFEGPFDDINNDGIIDRFDRAKTTFGQSKTLKEYFEKVKAIKAQKKEAEARQTELDRRQAIADAQAARGQTTSGGRGNYRSDRDNSGDGGYGGSSKRSADNRRSDLGFSDIRLKDNIELVGKSPSDINIYNFTYLNDPKVYQGVMAHEVPWASVKHDNGYLMVDYNKVDVDFKAIR